MYSMKITTRLVLYIYIPYTHIYIVRKLQCILHIYMYISYKYINIISHRYIHTHIKKILALMFNEHSELACVR